MAADVVLTAAPVALLLLLLLVSPWLLQDEVA
jgi:hypothetical protein